VVPAAFSLCNAVVPSPHPIDVVTHRPLPAAGPLAKATLPKEDNVINEVVADVTANALAILVVLLSWIAVGLGGGGGWGLGCSRQDPSMDCIGPC